MYDCMQYFCFFIDKEPTPPDSLSGGEIAAIVISVVTFCGVFIFLIILYDKNKKGELQPWYRSKKASFLRWYNRQRVWCRRQRNRCRSSCCCCKRRQRNHQQLAPPQPATPATQRPPVSVMIACLNCMHNNSKPCDSLRGKDNSSCNVGLLG